MSGVSPVEEVEVEVVFEEGGWQDAVGLGVESLGFAGVVGWV